MSRENHDLAVSFWRQGKLCVERRDFSDAIKQFEEAVRLAPHSVHIRRSLHDARCESRVRGDVGRLENLKLLKLKAQLLVETKWENWLSVFELAHSAQAIDPWDGDLCVALAQAAAQLGQDELSGLFFERAAELNPDSRKCLEAYARLLEKTNRLARALVIWQRISDLCPGDHGARRHAERLETLVYVSGKSQPEPKLRKKRPSGDDTVLDEGDTSHGTTPIPPPPRPPAAVPEPQAAPVQPIPPVRELPPEVVAQIRVLLADADRLVGECRLREAGRALKEAYAASNRDKRIGRLLHAVAGGDAKVPARKRVAVYRHLRQQQ